jgi:hypothetical protein
MISLVSYLEPDLTYTKTIISLYSGLQLVGGDLLVVAKNELTLIPLQRSVHISRRIHEHNISLKGLGIILRVL